MTQVGIVDYGMGNLLSVLSAVEMCGQDAVLCSHPEMLFDVDRIILPGVGAFSDCMRNLQATGLQDALHEAVLEQNKPILGICLGMQAMARRSFEGQETEGLGWFDADVVMLQPSEKQLRVPHVGWNNLVLKGTSPLFAGVVKPADVYFVHSYYMRCDSDEYVDAYCDHGGMVTAAVRKDNIFGTQFHPEKSQDIGLAILENFLAWIP